MNKKGVSPIIAAVLLIAAAITIGIIVTTWATQWVNTQIGDADVSCGVDTSYVVSSASYNGTGFNGTLLIKLTNKGKKALYGFGAIIDNGTQIARVNSTDDRISQGGISSSNKLEREKSAYISVALYTNLTSPGFGDSLLTSSNIEIKVTNKACDAVSAKTTSLS